jgi:hypothetical protein
MIIHTKLTKAYILERFNQVDMFAKYLNIDVKDIQDCINYGNFIHSPLRGSSGIDNANAEINDPRPSLGFKFNTKNKLKAKDFGGYFWGDIFDLVALFLNRNVNDSKDFNIILNHIYDTMSSDNSFTNTKTLLNNVRKEKYVFEVVVREYERYDRDFWQPIIYKHDYRKYLRDKYIFPIGYLWIDRHSQPYPKYETSRSNPAYAYYFMQDDRGIDNFKIYYPNSKDKFVTNCNIFQGLHLLPKEWDVLIITKSYKDVVSMLSFLDHIETDLTIAVIAPPSESYIITQEQYDYFASHTRLAFDYEGKYKAIISIYDFDYTGLTYSGQLKRKYGIQRFMFDKTFEKKDFTDNTKYYGKEHMFAIADNFVKYLEQIL